VQGCKLNLDIKPTVENKKLNNIINDIYKGQNSADPIGNGTTMDAVRYEKKTGLCVGGRNHTTKAQRLIKGINNVLLTKDILSKDVATAIALRDDLQDALNGN